MKNLLLALSITLLVSSCSLLYRGILGVDITPEWKSKEDIVKDSKKWKLDDSLVYILDTASYKNSIIKELYANLNELKKDSSSLDTVLWKKSVKIVNDDLQATQVRLFTSNGTEIFKLVNCYIDPPIPMNWNIDGCFDVFPPKIDEENLNIHNQDLNFFLNNITKLNGDSVQIIDLPKSDYYMVVLWNSFYIKPSRKLIKTVKKYIKSNPEESITPIYINNHNAQLWSVLDSAQRVLIFDYEVSLDKEQKEKD